MKCVKVTITTPMRVHIFGLPAPSEPFEKSTISMYVKTLAKDIWNEDFDKEFGKEGPASDEEEEAWDKGCFWNWEYEEE